MHCELFECCGVLKSQARFGKESQGGPEPKSVCFQAKVRPAAACRLLLLLLWEGEVTTLTTIMSKVGSAVNH